MKKKKSEFGAYAIGWLYLLAPVIILAVVLVVKYFINDDSFSALDMKTDAVLRQALKPEVKNAIVIIVAQRVSTIMDADQILVLDEGRLAASGRHEELLKTCPLYY